jgi:hypothetical protein
MVRYRNGFILMAVVVFLVSFMNPASGAGLFSGGWKGQWENSLGERGLDSLSLKEHHDGTIKGLWTNEVEVSGFRVNANTIELRGQTNNRSYQITATLDEDRDEMNLKYMVTRLNASGSYFGSSKLYRVKGK